MDGNHSIKHFPKQVKPQYTGGANNSSHQAKTLNALVPKSTKPQNTRQMHIPAKILSFIKQMRTQHPHLSKYKLKIFLDEFCTKQHLPTCSTSWIGKVTARHKLYFEVRKPVRKKRRHSRSEYTIKHTPNPTKLTMGYVQLDGVTVYWSGKKLVFLTALELKSRKAWVKLVPSANSYHASNLLHTVIQSFNYPKYIRCTQTTVVNSKHFLIKQSLICD